MAASAKPRPKMKWQSAPAELVSLFEQTVRHFRDAQLRKMFGYPAAFVNGNMIGGLFQDQMMLRLPAADRVTIGRDGAQPFEPMPGRVMREYMVVPDHILHSDVRLKAWMGKAFVHTKSLPAKPAKSARRPVKAGRGK